MFFSSTLLAFIMELLKNSIAMQDQMLSCKGFLVIGYSLEKVKTNKQKYPFLISCLCLILFFWGGGFGGGGGKGGNSVDTVISRVLV